ncbi:MAG: peptide chain release factor-like protein [Gemmataceae bacterium]|nr:peptide chain release factor-like protein [Gemmataceae bacterium]MDW8264530.1 peptide chain release factor-like protein [Gemmataceae bacterium]
MTAAERQRWAEQSDRDLLAECQVDTYRASGPGGQKRNKTSSAVRLRHLPSGLSVIAEESRSQHENRARALRRLRRAFYLKLRVPLAAEHLRPDDLPAWSAMQADRGPEARLRLGPKDPRFWPVLAEVLDVLEAVGARVSVAAHRLGVSTAQLVGLLESDPKVWEQVQQMRLRFGERPLKLG